MQSTAKTIHLDETEQDLSKAKTAARGAAREAESHAVYTLRNLADRAETIGKSVSEQIHDKPYQSGFIALAVGIIAGLMIRR
jgi:ElaB/YqjD/DUF883 family membrane-anchored ribosome-binding protein